MSRLMDDDENYRRRLLPWSGGGISPVSESIHLKI